MHVRPSMFEGQSWPLFQKRKESYNTVLYLYSATDVVRHLLEQTLHSSRHLTSHPNP